MNGGFYVVILFNGLDSAVGALRITTMLVVPDSSGRTSVGMDLPSTLTLCNPTARVLATGNELEEKFQSREKMPALGPSHIFSHFNPAISFWTDFGAFGLS